VAWIRANLIMGLRKELGVKGSTLRVRLRTLCETRHGKCVNSALPLKHGMSSHVHASAFEKAIVGHCVGQTDGDTKMGVYLWS
jgi:hypothetical protein